jgi:hypothetical protein
LLYDSKLLITQGQLEMEDSQQAPIVKPTATSEEIKKRFSDAGVNKDSFLNGTLTAAQLQAYLMSVAPLEIPSTTEEKELWDKALVENKKRCFPENIQNHEPQASE